MTAKTTNRPSKYAAHRAIIAEMLMRGDTSRKIAETLGLKPKGIDAYIARESLQRRPDKRRVTLAINIGRMGWLENFDASQIKQLEAEAIRIGCESLSEIAIEIIRDYLADRNVQA